MATDKQLKAFCKAREIALKLPRTEKQRENAREACRKMHKLPRTDKQREACRKLGLSKKGKLHPHKGNLFADDIVEHHNDLCHGAERSDDISYMAMSEHSSLHAKIRVKDETHPFLAKNR